jgi:hypothetical protein
MAMLSPALPHVVIRASAGTGKTLQLLQRYLSLLNAGASPAQILAVTFTRKAAGEILDRLLVGLAEAVHSATALQALQQQVTGPALDRDRCLTLLKTLLRDLHRLQISTLDSFFVQVARGFALELGLPVDWQIVEGQDDQRLRAHAMQAFLADDALDDLVRVLRLLSKGEAPRAVVGSLTDLATDLATLAQQTAAEAWDVLPRLEPLSPAAVEDVLQQLSTFTFADTRFTKARDGDVAAARREAWADLVTKGLAGHIITEECTYHKKSIEPAVCDAYQPLLGHAQAVLLEEIAEQTAATRRVLDRFQQAAHRPAFAELEHRRDRRLEIGDEPCPHHLGAAGAVGASELGKRRLRLEIPRDNVELGHGDAS